MTRYKLPEVLGGHEVEVIYAHADAWDVHVLLPDESFPMTLPRAVLEEIELPPEPPNLTALRAGTTVYQRFVHFDPTTAREMARALWTAADQSEAAS